MFGTMAMTVGVFFARSTSQTNLENNLDYYGNYDIVVPLIEKEELQRLFEREDIAQCETILNGGTCKTKYSARVRFGAMESPGAQELFHYEPEKKGRYPAAVGEICGYRSSFEAMGVAPVLGNRLELELYDVEGDYVETREFTIVGVLNDQKDIYGESYRTMEHISMMSFIGLTLDDIDFPQMFLYKEDIPENYTTTAIARCTPDSVPWYVETELRKDGIGACYNYRLAAYTMVAQIDAKTENELYDRVDLAYKDFYSSTVIPVFMGIVLLVSFISIYGVMKAAMLERQRQLGLLRSLGMSKCQVMKTLLGEAFLFDAVGVTAGYALGILVYAVYLQVINSFGNIYIYSAFHADPAAKAVSLNPYLYPWLLGIVFSVPAVIIPLVKGCRMSPNEMLFPEKAAEITRKGSGVKPHRMIGKIVGMKRNRDKGVVLLIFITSWTFVFGAAFMLGKSDSDNSTVMGRLNEVSKVDADYYVGKDFSNKEVGNLQYNRHDMGVSKEDMHVLREGEDVAELLAVMRLPGVQLLYQESTIPENLREALSKLDTVHNVGEGLGELFYKSKIAKGYSEEDLMYGLPCVAIDDDLLESLEQYVVSGELDIEGLRNGSKIAIVEYPDAEMTNPYAVGDQVSLTDAVIFDPYVEAFDFSHGEVPLGYAPTFYYDDTDGLRTHSPGYAFGEKVVFDAEVCAVLYIGDEYLGQRLYAESFVSNERRTGYISPGYNIICSVEAPSKWGLPDRCYTDVYVNLKSGADLDRFETLWYTVIGRSGDVINISQSAVKRKILMTDLSNVVLFASMIVLVILAGCFGMVNAYHFAVNKNMHNIQILRAVGMSRRMMISSYVRGMFFLPLIAAVTSIIPVGIFDLMARYTYHYAIEQEHFNYLIAENGKMVAECWQLRFPWYIHMWEQPVVLLMVVGFVSASLINIAAGLVPMNRMQRMSIVDGIRNEDF